MSFNIIVIASWYRQNKAAADKEEKCKLTKKTKM